MFEIMYVYVALAGAAILYVGQTIYTKLKKPVGSTTTPSVTLQPQLLSAQDNNAKHVDFLHELIKALLQNQNVSLTKASDPPVDKKV